MTSIGMPLLLMKNVLGTVSTGSVNDELRRNAEDVWTLARNTGKSGP